MSMRLTHSNLPFNQIVYSTIKSCNDVWILVIKLYFNIVIGGVQLLFDIVCGHMGVIRTHDKDGSTSGPPAESEYAVEPFDVATITPSPLQNDSVVCYLQRHTECYCVEDVFSTNR